MFSNKTTANIVLASRFSSAINICLPKAIGVNCFAYSFRAITSDLEAKVAIIEQNTGTDSSVLAKLDEIQNGVQENANAISAVRAARLDDLDRFAPSLIVEAIAADLEDVKEIVGGLAWIPQEFNMVWDRLDELEDK